MHIIRYNGNLKKLIRNDITYIEIVNNIEHLIKDGKLEYIKDKLKLTKQGTKLFNELSLKYKNTNKDKWIEKEENSRIEKLDLNFVFLPDQDELYF